MAATAVAKRLSIGIAALQQLFATVTNYSPSATYKALLC
jgi:hypothetical protein